MNKMEYDDLTMLNNFDWYYKDLFIWKNKYYYSKGKRIVFFGEKIENPKFTVVLKKFKVDDRNYKQILKELYFLVCCQKSNYFIKLVDIFLSKDQDYIFLILKDEGANLLELIDYAANNQEGFDYTQMEDMIKWIIFQIICGLYILHKNKLIHHDIKPGNILISSTGVVKIADFGSVDKSCTRGNGTLLYESPQVLLRQTGDEKDDMWAVGIIMVELYKKYFPFFNWEQYENQKNEVGKKILQLKSILSKYKININGKEIDINNNNDFYSISQKLTEKNFFEKNNFKEELCNIEEINDKEAFDLINNLLKINPQKRFSAEEALNSNYLSKFKNEFKMSQISYILKDYDTLITNVNNKNDFIKNVETIKQKYLGEVLFE